MRDSSAKLEQSIEYKILSAVSGRLRLKVPHHLRSKTYRQQLAQWFDFLTDGTVTDLRINGLTESLTIHFDPEKISLVKLEKLLIKALYEATQASPPSPQSSHSSPPPPSPQSSPSSSPPTDHSPQTAIAPETPHFVETEKLAEEVTLTPSLAAVQTLADQELISETTELPIPQNVTPELSEEVNFQTFPPEFSVAIAAPAPRPTVAPPVESKPVEAKLPLPFAEAEPKAIEPLLILSVNPLTRQCEEQAELMETLADQIAQLRPVAAIGEAYLSKWHSHSPSTVDLFSQAVELGNQLLSIPEINPGSWEQLARQQSKAIAVLQSELGDLQRFAVIGETKLNKWRKKSY